MAGQETPTFEVLIAVQTLSQGGALAFPVAAPELAVYEPDGDWREEMRRGLEKLLPTYAPEMLAALLLRRGELLEVTVELDLRARELDRGGSLFATFPCLVATEGQQRQVSVLRLGHTFFAGAKEDLPKLAATEIRRILTSRLAAGEDPLRLLPPLQTDLELLQVRLGPAQEGKKKNERAADLELLAEVGTLWRPSSQGILPRPELETRLSARMAGRRRGTLILVGEEGVGKSALLRRVLAGRDHVYLTSGSRWVAGQSMLGQLEERVQQVMAAARRLDAVIYFERFDELLVAREGSDDLLSLFRRHVVAEEVRFVGELASEQLDEARRSHTSLFAAAEVIRVEPLSAAETSEVLHARLMELLPEPEHAELRASLATALLELSTRYFQEKKLPGMPMRLLDELAADDREARAGGRHLQLADLYRLVGTLTGIPEFLLREDLALRLETLRATFRRHLIGQGEAVEQLLAVLCAVKARLQPEGKPLAVLLFVGPTGVGKTEAARCLARVLFGDEQRLIRFDMSEYSDPYAADRLIRGNDREEGLLTRRVRREPFGVILLDEIEKADRAVFDLLLQVAGEGRLTDARGRTAFFHNIILVMTSNLGATEQRSATLGFGDTRQNVQAFYRIQVENFFRPEMVNRLDRVIAFLPLSREQVAEITRLQIAGLARRRGFEERGLELEVSDDLVADLASDSYAPAHGARRLRRELQRRLLAPIAELIAAHTLLAREGRIWVGRADEAPPAGSAPRIVSRGVCCELRRPAGAPARSRSEDLGELRLLRRLAQRLWNAETLQNLVHEEGMARRQLFETRLRLQQLGRDQGRGGRGKKSAPDAAAGRLIAEATRLEQRRHHFGTVLAPLRDLLQELGDAEEIALAEELAGQPPEGLAKIVAAGRERLRGALGPALLAPDQGRPLTLLISEADDQQAMVYWLKTLLPYAEERGWPLRGWPFGAQTRLGDDDVLPAGKIVEWLATPKRPRQFLLEVDVAEAAARLTWEAGWHRFERESDKAQTAHLEVQRVLRGRSKYEQREALRRQHVLRQAPAGDVLRLQTFVRDWNIEGDWWWPRKPAGRGPMLQALLRAGGLGSDPILGVEYWRRQPEILATQLALYELDEELDRERDVAQQLLGGTR